MYTGFPGGSDSKESTCKRETRVWALGWEDPLEEGMATQSSIPAWESPGTGGWWAVVHGVAESDMTERLSAAHKESLSPKNARTTDLTVNSQVQKGILLLVFLPLESQISVKNSAWKNKL